MGNCKIIQTIVDDGKSECIRLFPINNVANVTNGCYLGNGNTHQVICSIIDVMGFSFVLSTIK
jgi:hypothetical protein